MLARRLLYSSKVGSNPFKCSKFLLLKHNLTEKGNMRFEIEPFVMCAMSACSIVRAKNRVDMVKARRLLTNTIYN